MATWGVWLQHYNVTVTLSAVWYWAGTVEAGNKLQNISKTESNSKLKVATKLHRAEWNCRTDYNCGFIAMSDIFHITHKYESSVNKKSS